MIVTKEPLELANEDLIVNLCTRYVLNRNIGLCPTDVMYTTYKFKLTLSKNTINTAAAATTIRAVINNNNNDNMQSLRH
jgi:hypothetical protein